MMSEVSDPGPIIAVGEVEITALRSVELGGNGGRVSVRDASTYGCSAADSLAANMSASCLSNLRREYTEAGRQRHAALGSMRWQGLWVSRPRTDDASCVDCGSVSRSP